jgi:exosortase/archaeosortase family protein
MKRKTIERRKMLFGILWFIVKLNLLVIPLYALLALDFSIPQLQSWIASAISSGLGLLGHPSTTVGKFVYVSSGQIYSAFEISMDCTGWKSIYLIAALAIATPSDRMSKVRFLAISVPAIFILNYARILTTIIFAFSYGFQYLDIVHTLLWREGLIFAVLAFWFIWLRKSNYNIRYLETGARWKFGRRRASNDSGKKNIRP